MKKLYFGTNLKMYKTIRDTEAYLKLLQDRTRDLDRDRVTLFVIPSYTALDRASTCVDQTLIRLGAQNMCWEERGPFTGEISPLMLQELGLHIVELGHSERRHVFGEDDRMVGRKAACALAHGFTALLCVGETGEEKELGLSDEVLRTQLKAGLHGLTPEDAERLWVAYEPVWAIGEQGQPASAGYAQEKHAVIKAALGELFGSREIPVLYGGSVNPGNARELIVQPDIDGLFVGRSAWEAEKFNKLIRDAIHACEGQDQVRGVRTARGC